MANLYVISGPCGCGKTTLSAVFAQRLGKPVYLIHGDDFQAGFVLPDKDDGPSWPELLQFNWDCIIATARSALAMGTDVVIDYIVEDELPRLKSMAADFGAALHYTVLTAAEDILHDRLIRRGDTWLVQRALFLKQKLESLPENQGRILNVSNLSVEQTVDLLLKSNI